MTLRACRACGGWHRLEDEWPAECAGHFRINDKRSDFATPMIISDTMGAIQSQLTGKYYDSKSSLRREYKAHGVTEIGNEKVNTIAPERPRITKQEIGSAIQKVAQGYKPAAHGVALAKETGANWH